MFSSISLSLSHLAEDISIVFRKDNWEGKADFSQADVHRQIAIVFKTPPYQHLDITGPVEVEVYLQRLTDSVSSDAVNFTYLPMDNGKVLPLLSVPGLGLEEGKPPGPCGS